MRGDAIGRKAGGKKALILVVARESGNNGLRAKMRHIHGYVCRTTGFLVLVDATHHGDGSLGGEMRPTSPQMYLSSITSPTTSRCLLLHSCSISWITSGAAGRSPRLLHWQPSASRQLDGLAEGCCYHNGVGDWETNPFKGKLQTIFLDRDGVLNEKMPEGRWVSAWEEFHVLPGVPETIARLNDAGLRVIVVSNQRGIALGVLSLADVEAIQLRFEDLLAEQGARVDAFYVCPHDRLECNCRKPLPGMFLQAQREFPEITAASSAMFGDSLADIEFGRRLGMLTVLIDGDANRASSRHRGRSKAGRPAVFVICKGRGCAAAIAQSVSAQIKNGFEDRVGLRQDRSSSTGW